VRVRYELLVIVPLVVALAAVPATYAFAASSRTESSAPPVNPTLGKQLYRELCSQCHALAQASSAGFAGDNGSGQSGGPSFNDVKVPYDLTIVAVTEGFAPAGHRFVVERMTWAELDDVATWLAAATKNQASLARFSEDCSGLATPCARSESHD
jgi:mono/diheme cytochrome c family protein